MNRWADIQKKKYNYYEDLANRHRARIIDISVDEYMLTVRKKYTDRHTWKQVE